MIESGGEVRKESPAAVDRATLGGEPVMLEMLRTAAKPEEVAYLEACVFADAGLDVEEVPRGRESLAFLAGMAVRCREAGEPFEATWSLLSDRKGLEAIDDSSVREFWARVRRAMKSLATPGWRP